MQLQRDGQGDWQPVGVWLGTLAGLQSRFRPGSGLDDFVRRTHEFARPPIVDGQSTRGSWEDWIGYALDALSNGHDLHIVEVEPEVTVDRLYAREVLGISGDALAAYSPKGIANVTNVSGLDTGATPLSRA